MTERDLRRLSRQDLLQLLLVQSKDVTRLRSSVDEQNRALEDERELSGRLKAKLDEKDETIERLKQRLDEKDETISRLKTDAEALEIRLNKKSLALEAARAKLEQRSVGGKRPNPDAPQADAASDEAKQINRSVEERLRYLKNELARSEALADRLRKEQK